jgi:Tfp pilus assembly protein PilF
MRTGSKVVLSVALAIAAGMGAGCSSRLDLTRSSTQMEFGVRMARANLWREALFRFERAVQIDPENAEALNNLAVAYEGIGEFEKARDAYARALRVDKSNQHIQKNYSRFVEFYSRNRKREQQLQQVAKAGEDAAAPSEPEPEPEPAAPVELSSPEEPPKPGEIPVSDVPPDPVPPPPPPGGSP